MYRVAVFIGYSVEKVLIKLQRRKEIKQINSKNINLDIYIYVTYIPKFEGKKHYLFVTIDNAIRDMYHKVYVVKTNANSEDFMSIS